MYSSCGVWVSTVHARCRVYHSVDAGILSAHPLWEDVQASTRDYRCRSSHWCKRVRYTVCNATLNPPLPHEIRIQD